MNATLECGLLSEEDKDTAQLLSPGQVVQIAEEAPAEFPLNGSSSTDMDFRHLRKTYSRPFFLPTPGKKPRYLQEKEWLGLVTSISEDGFVARLRDYQGGPDLETTFLCQEIPQEDLELIQVGAEFYWSLGYRDDPNGQRQRYSQVRFRRLPKWTAQNIIEARQRARELLRGIQLEADGST